MFCSKQTQGTQMIFWSYVFFERKEICLPYMEWYYTKGIFSRLANISVVVHYIFVSSFQLGNFRSSDD